MNTNHVVLIRENIFFFSFSFHHELSGAFPKYGGSIYVTFKLFIFKALFLASLAIHKGAVKSRLESYFAWS